MDYQDVTLPVTVAAAISENRGPELVAIIASFLAITWIMVGLRCYVRIRMLNSFAIDDWLTLVTTFFFTIYCGLCFVAVYWGGGRHALDLTMHHNMNALRIWWCCELFYIASSTFVRLAACYFLLRFAQRRWHRIVLHGCNIVNISFNTYFLTGCFLQCRPLSYFWTRIDLMHEGSCAMLWGIINTYVQIGLMAAIDYILGFLPIFILYNLNIERKRKILLGMILSLVCLAGTATLVRIPYVYSLAQSGDFLWYTVDLSIWSSIEPGLGLIALCLVSYGPLLRSILAGRGNATTSPSTMATSHMKSNLQRQYWNQTDTELQLRGLPTHLGNTSIIEGPGKKSRSRSRSKSNSPARAWGVNFEDHRRGNKIVKMSLTKSRDGSQFVITKTTDIETWSDGEDIEMAGPRPRKEYF